MNESSAPTVSHQHYNETTLSETTLFEDLLSFNLEHSWNDKRKIVMLTHSNQEAFKVK